VLSDGGTDAPFWQTDESEGKVSVLGDWNKRFQASLARIRRFTQVTPLKQRIQANLDLMHLAQDFIYCATVYGKIIISEYYLDVSSKTIKPNYDLPGYMGGQKYVVHNILFKFAVDYNGLFGNDYSAAKVAGNELRGLISYFNCGIKDLNVPLMALVDYRGILAFLIFFFFFSFPMYLGYRLIALSILPVNENTIIYGSW